MSETQQTRLYGLVAEFQSPEEILNASQKTHDAGYRAIDAYSPMMIEGLSEALGFKKSYLPLMVLIGGICGMLFGFFLQFYANVVSFPLNIDGKPHNSWPSFIPITFELTILFASIVAFLGMLGLNRLPKLHHPLFDIPRFALATDDRFFLCIEARDRLFDLEKTKEFLNGLQPAYVYALEE
jgi:hypothetical protein